MAKKAPAKTTFPGSFTATLEKFDSNLWYYHVVVPNEIAQHFVNGTDRRVVCTINGQTELQCALMPKGGNLYFININKKIRDELGLKPGSQVEISLRKDESEYGLPMPEELAELLGMDDEGNELFHALTPGKQRTLLYIIDKPKNVDIRIRRAIAIVNHLKGNHGKVNYRQLNEEMKAR